MKAMMMAASILLAALPASAISYGGCCARVGGSCISSCQKVGGCTGSGDCTLTWITSAAGGSLNGSEPWARSTASSADPARLQSVARSVVEVSQPEGPTEIPLATCVLRIF